ncbi:uncharacterized protein DS421_16g567500 [Arachis hypogaea]|nr:uncharacterized protein DS421_16g567500 [Arachis hypogaea]
MLCSFTTHEQSLQPWFQRKVSQNLGSLLFLLLLLRIPPRSTTMTACLLDVVWVFILEQHTIIGASIYLNIVKT